VIEADGGCNDLSQTLALVNSDATTIVTSLTPGDATTCSSDNGTLTFTVSGNTSSFQYKIDDDGSWEDASGSPVDVSGIAVGDHTLTIKADGCENPGGSFTIGATNSGIAFTLSADADATCAGALGLLGINVSSGTPSHYRINKGAWIAMSGSVQVPVAAGNYIVELKTASGCITVADTQDIDLDQSNGGFTVSLNSTTPTSCGLFNGTITIDIDPTTNNYSYSLDNGVTYKAFSGSPYVIENLSAGKYNVKIQNISNGCVANVNGAEVGQGSSGILAGSISVNSQPTCSNSDGSIKIIVTGGSGYQYSINGSTPATLPTNGVISGLSAGNYVVSVSAANGCNDISQTLALVNSDASTIVTSLTPTDATTCSSNDGSLSFTVSGNTGNFRYKIDNGSWANATGSPVNVSNIAVGEHTLTIEDADGCENPGGSFTISATTSGITFTLSEDLKASCTGADGVLGINVTAGTPSHYRLNEGLWVAMNGSIQIAVPAGVHKIELKDASGCVAVSKTLAIGIDGSSFTASLDATTSASCGVNNGTITLTITPNGSYSYSMDNGATYKAFSGSSYVIGNLATGIYDIKIKDGSNCVSNVYNAEVKQGVTPLIPPTATTPQNFCTYAEVIDLQANGADIEWFTTATGGTALAMDYPLDSGVIYYAGQKLGICASEVRTAVKVFIEPNLILNPPILAGIQPLCQDMSVLTLEDIATDGNTNIVWYENYAGGTELPLTTPLEDGVSYYAGMKAGTCQSSMRTEVIVNFVSTNPDSLILNSPQSFCEGALVANIAVPHNQVVWYAEKTGGDPIPKESLLVDGATYYAAYKAGDCQGEKRTPVTVYLNGDPEKPEAPPAQSNCDEKINTLADLTITGGGIVWYDENKNPLPPSTTLIAGTTYYAAQSSTNCVGDTLGIKIIIDCYTLRGTVFPFVQKGESNFDELFPVIVRLYQVPAAKGNGIRFMTQQQPLYTSQATFYDWHTDTIPGTPKYPGTMSWLNNPGLPIDWTQIFQTPGIPNPLVVTPSSPQIFAQHQGMQVGKYEFKNIPEGAYLLVVLRPGYLTRIGKITVEAGREYLGHREILAGDLNSDYQINAMDGSLLRGKFEIKWYDEILDFYDPRFDPRYDLDGDGHINDKDFNYTNVYGGASFSIYQEMVNWLMEP
jgi:hypothetical protein